jgi:hypothetical protein
MDYFAGLDTSMDETAKAWWFARARRRRRHRRLLTNGESAKLSSHGIRDGRMAPILFALATCRCSPSILPDQMAPIVRNGADGERELRRGAEDAIAPGIGIAVSGAVSLLEDGNGAAQICGRAELQVHRPSTDASARGAYMIVKTPRVRRHPAIAS